MKYLYSISLPFLLWGCGESEKELLIKDVSFSSYTIETCIKERAEIEGFTKVEEMTEVLCKGSGLDFGNFEDFNQFPNLTGVALHSIETTNVEIADNLYIEELWVVSAENLSTFRASNSPNLKIIKFLNSNNLSHVALEQLPNMSDLSIRDARIEVLDIAAIDSLEYLEVATDAATANIRNVTSPIDYIDLTTHVNLKELNLSYISLETLLLDGLDNLTHLFVVGTDLQFVDLNLKNLERLELISNKLEAIDLSLVPNIEYLNLAENNLTNINLDMNTKLEYARLIANPLSDQTIAYLNTIDWIEELIFN
ncbi:hypothetical protein [Thalassotalea sp. PS06]|uniref:hypothetical protein n=1 Tax=Thalassotalea sp. PS06 TaxID=2594005 RepID=UPI001164F9E1|nr:hypothetical protein [Thalassotalea sp. PS06]QDP00667.1 hypothetical protein FNC98_04440 [Thalassotalea sp. PS06]